MTTSGTGLVVCAVCGLTPSAASNCSAFPWSAVMRQTPPAADTASTTRPRHSSVVSTASIDGRLRAGVPDHVGVREVDHAERVAVADLRAEALGRLARRHLGLVVVARDVARARDEDPRLARPLLLAAAVEEVGDVRVLLRLGDVQLSQAGSGQHLRERVLDLDLAEDDGAVELVAVSRHRRQVVAAVEQ